MKHLLPLFPRPSRYLGSEWGAVRKDPATVAVRLALAFPDLYEVGMSYLGQQILYELANARDDCWAERVFSPDAEVAAILRQHGAQLATLESDTPLAGLDAVAFHLTHELCTTNVLLMLDLAGIPLRAGQRADEHPLILGGGGQAMNAEPMAEFFDALVLGDGEAGLPPVIDLLKQSKAEGWSRAKLLDRLAEVPGIYVPSLFEFHGQGKPLTPRKAGYETVGKVTVPDMRAVHPLTRPVVPFGQAVHDRYSLEIARGCTRGCRFCHAGMVYRPVRERDPAGLTSTLDNVLQAAGYEETSFLSLSTGDYSALDGLFEQSFERCSSQQVAISLPSLRVGSVSSKLMGLISRIRRTGVTLAPEAGSQRLRDVINKGITEDALLDHVRRLYAHGWRQVKLYFMIGLPTETEDDLRAIFELADAVEAAPRSLEGFQKGRPLNVTASVGTFVPKPHTPFQWERQINLDETRERIGLLRELFSQRKRLKLKWHEPRMSLLEGVLSRGGRELAPVIETAYAKGALFDAWVDQLDLRIWLEALEDHGLRAEDFLRGRDLDEPLPWDHLHPGISRDFLLRERQRALDGKLTKDCRYHACSKCGVCEGELKPVVINAERDQAGTPETDAPPPSPPSQGKERPPELPEEITRRAAHFRVWFTRTGAAAWLSALEQQSVLERALRRAGIDVAFSAGFHPLPLLSFGRALPVGVESLAEWFNVFTRQEYDPAQVAENLDAALPAGFSVLRAEPLTLGKKQPQPDIEEFEVRLADGHDGLMQDFDAAWQAFAQAQSFAVTKPGKKGERTIDVRPLVTDVRIEPGVARLTCDWSKGYISPVFLAHSVTNAPASALRLRKTTQRFA